MKLLIRCRIIMYMSYTVLIGIFFFFNCNFLMASEVSNNKQYEKENLCLSLLKEITNLEFEIKDLNFQYKQLQDKDWEITGKYEEKIDNLRSQQRQYSYDDYRYEKLQERIRELEDMRNDETYPIDEKYHHLEDNLNQKKKYLEKLKKKQSLLNCK